MQYATLSFERSSGLQGVIKVSQGENVATHVYTLSNDYNGADTGKDWLLAPFDCIVKAIRTYDNQILFANVDSVMTPSGVQEHVCFTPTHMDDVDFKQLGIVVGKTFKQGERIYREGTKGIGSGNHIHMSQAFGPFKGGTPTVKMGKTYTYNGKKYEQYKINADNEVSAYAAFFVGCPVVKGLSDTANAYKWHEVPKEEREMEKIVTRIQRDPEFDYRWSVDGNRYGTPYDKTVPVGFGDKLLEEDGWEKELMINGSTFFTGDSGECIAEGLEISRGVNNQEFDMVAVSKFAECMAVGFDKEGGMDIEWQGTIQHRYETGKKDYYGAVTGAFGVLHDGQVDESGKELSQSARNGIYEALSGRTIFGQDKNTGDYVVITIPGTTGKAGAYGNQLPSICQEEGMTDALCFDGGGSVFLWRKEDGLVLPTDGRKIKNAIILYRKKKDIEQEPETPTPKPAEPQEPEQPMPDDTDDEVKNIGKQLIELVLSVFKYIWKLIKKEG